MKLSTALTLIVIGVVMALIAHDAMGDRAALPPALQERIVQYETTFVIDTAAVNRLEREKAVSRRRELQAAAAGKVSDSIAMAKGRAADSAAAIARAAQTSADSARAWHAAYDARTIEADSLRSSRDSARSELREVRAQRDSTERQSAIWQKRATDADGIIRDLRPLAAQASRRWHTGAGVGYGCSDRGCGPVVVGAVTYEVRLPKLRIPGLRR